MKKINTFATKLFNSKRFFSQDLKKQCLPIANLENHLPKPEYDIDFLCDLTNRDSIYENIKRRKSSGDIDKVLNLSQCTDKESELLQEIKKIPNTTHPKVLKYENNNPYVLKTFGKLPEFDYEIKDFAVLTKELKIMRTDKLGPVSGSRSYALLDSLAELENAIVLFALKKLKEHNFNFISVPDILPTKVIERCGLITDDYERHLVYEMAPFYGDNLSLSGTSEMALAYMLSNKEFSCSQLPLKLAAVSRCFRAEVSTLLEERGIYRVHQFTKVEMFVCTEQNKSEDMMNDIINIQESIFKDLGLHFKVMDMPPNELGLPAYRKIDIEAWMPGRKLFGELSSCSNCTDYQARRLHIKYLTNDNKTLFVHTLNGTAAAIPRLLIAICETYQQEDGSIKIPECLLPYMDGRTVIENQNENVPDMRPYKFKSRTY